MAKRKGARKAAGRRTRRKPAATRKSVSRPKARKTAVRRSVKTAAARPAKKTAPRRPAVRTAKTAAAGSKRPRPARHAAARSTTQPFGPPPPDNRGTRTKASRLDRERRRLEETVPTPPSSLNMQRRGTSARTGRKELADTLEEHVGMTAVTGGDIDADFETAYFSGDETPGGDNPTPDQDIVDDIGKSLGVEYQDNEELKAADKVVERDKHRWELDPASSEDYKDRD